MKISAGGTLYSSIVTIGAWFLARHFDMPPDVQQAIVVAGLFFVSLFARNEADSVKHEEATAKNTTAIAVNTGAIASEQSQINAGCAEQAGQVLSPKEGGNG